MNLATRTTMTVAFCLFGTACASSSPDPSPTGSTRQATGLGSGGGGSGSGGSSSGGSSSGGSGSSSGGFVGTCGSESLPWETFGPDVKRRQNYVDSSQANSWGVSLTSPGCQLGQYSQGVNVLGKTDYSWVVAQGVACPQCYCAGPPGSSASAVCTDAGF